MGRATEHENRLKKYAKKLVRISMDKGHVSLERVRGVINALNMDPPRQFKRILNYYAFYLEIEMRRTAAQINYAGTLDQESIKKIQMMLSQFYGERIDVVANEDPSLISGIRIHIGDDVWDTSVRGALDELANAF